MTGEREGGGRRVVPFLYSRGRDIGYQLLVADEQRLGTPASEQLIRSLPPGTSPPGTVFLTHLAGGVRTVFRKEPLESADSGWTAPRWTVRDEASSSPSAGSFPPA